jgi:uncharacterized protein involved in outer membrane biogenesis
VATVARLPRWLWITAAVLIVLVALALVIPSFLDVDRYRTLIAAAIEKETGRKVVLGKIRARLLPNVGFTIDTFALGNPAGFPEGNVLSVETVRGSLAWRPLLSREFQLSAIELDGVKVTLVEDERGAMNYLFEKPKQAKPSSGGIEFRVADIDSIRLTNVELTAGRIAGRRRQVMPYIRAWKVNATLRDVALDAARLKQWRGDADLAGVIVELAGLNAPAEFRSGDLKLEKGALASKFEADAGKLGRVKGTLRVADIEKAVVTFDLSTAVLDLDQLAAAGAQTSAPPPARPRNSELLAQGRIAAERLRWAPYEATSATAEVRLFTDRLEAWPVTMAFYGGSIGVSARVDLRQTPERFSSNIEVRNVDVGKLLAASPQTRGKLTGTGEVTLQAFGSLSSNLRNSLSGTGNFAVRDGSLPAVNVGGTMQALAKVQQVLSLGSLGANLNEATRFSLLNGDLALREGRVHSNRIHMDSNQGTVDLRGSFGFDRTLDYDGQAVLTRSQSGQAQNPAGAVIGIIGGVMKQTVGRISVPFAVRGTFDDPKIQPGRGLPGVHTGSTEQTQTQQQQQQPEKKKSIFDIFKRPPEP